MSRMPVQVVNHLTRNMIHFRNGIREYFSMIFYG